jgi:hypothetical protein
MNIEVGNLDVLTKQNPERRGWFLGSFIPEGLLHSNACEVKWARRPKGSKRTTGMKIDKNIRTVVILISGKWKTIFPEDREEIILSNSGDYLIYEGTYHENEALEDSHILVLRYKKIIE